MNVNDRFRHFAELVSRLAGSPWAFAASVVAVVAWAALGPRYGFSDTWQLVMSTGASVVTFLIVFVIQNSQNRDTRAVQLKLDELIRSVEGARSTLVGLEDMSEAELARLEAEFERLRARDAANRPSTTPQP